MEKYFTRKRHIGNRKLIKKNECILVIFVALVINIALNKYCRINKLKKIFNKSFRLNFISADELILSKTS